MQPELILCIPGPWKDRSDFVRQVITLAPMGHYMFAGGVLADVMGKDHIGLDIAPADPDMVSAFEIAGQGKIPLSTLTSVGGHMSVAYLHFPLDLLAQRQRMAKFSGLLQRLGGIAIKVESAGVAHTWERWFELLNGSLFDRYCAAVVLIGGEDRFYSCGMHQFGLPECSVPMAVPITEAADLMNRFNMWQLDERPTLLTGHTFSISARAPHYRLRLEADLQHAEDELFFNVQGVWMLDPV